MKKCGDIVTVYEASDKIGGQWKRTYLSISLRNYLKQAEGQAIIQSFKQRKEPEKSVVTLAGTGPNGASQVHILSELGGEYLKSIKDIHIISGGAFSFFIYLANELSRLNIENFKQYEKFIKKRHSLPFLKKLIHIITIKFNSKSLYPNTHIKDTFSYLFDSAFGELCIKDIDYSVNFYSYDTRKKNITALNRYSYPNMKLKDVARACISVPPIHGHFNYQGKHFIDPVFSPYFSSLQRKLFRQRGNHLFVSHKKNQKKKTVYFLSHSNSRYPNLRLFTDFVLLYFGIPNRTITKTIHALLEKGIINGL